MITLTARDQKFIWHPFAQHGIEAEFLPVVAAEGAWLQLADGRKIIDAVASWWVNIHGHGHPVLAKAIYQQAQKLDHVIFAGFTHEPAIELAEILLNAVQTQQTNLSRCFYSDNGATSVEVALKMAFQYYKNKGIKTRTKFLALKNSYHGDTLGAMALSMRGSVHQHFTELLPEVDYVATGDLTELQQALERDGKHYAAFIVEPIVQAAGGMQIYSNEFLSAAVKLCQQHGILVICDEVFTGFYRTGKCFAFEHANIKPDLVCLAKGLTGGILPLAVTLVTEEIFASFKSQEMQRTFYHGHSYTANPIACAAAIASWQLLHQEKTQQAINKITNKTSAWIEHLAKSNQVKKFRNLGTIGVIELGDAYNYFSTINYKIRSFAIENGVLLRPLGNVVYALPPYCVTEAEIDQIYSVMETVANNIENFK